MKVTVVLVVAVGLFLSGWRAYGQGTAAPVQEGKTTHLKVPLVPAPPVQSRALANPLFVRGWQITAVSAINRGQVKELFPEYRDQKFRGTVTNSLPPAKGSFLVVLVQCQSATGQPLNQPLWAGRPDVILVDEQGFEYAPEGKLIQQGVDYVVPGMIARSHGKGPRRPASANENALVYFDVPKTSQAFWLRFASDPGLVPVNRRAVLPDLPID